MYMENWEKKNESKNQVTYTYLRISVFSCCYKTKNKQKKKEKKWVRQYSKIFAFFIEWQIRCGNLIESQVKQLKWLQNLRHLEGKVWKRVEKNNQRTML